MDCSICSSMPFLLRPPRNTICGACYEGAKSIITLMNKLEGDKGTDSIDTKPNNSLLSPANSCKASSILFIVLSNFLYCHKLLAELCSD